MALPLVLVSGKGVRQILPLSLTLTGNGGPSTREPAREREGRGYLTDLLLGSAVDLRV